MTILDVGRCLGSGESPREGTEESAEGKSSGVCVACSGRFAIEDGCVVAHEAAADDAREAMETDSSV